MANIRFTSLCSIYSYCINDIHSRASIREDVCFGTSLRECRNERNTASYTIVLILLDVKTPIGKLFKAYSNT